MFINASAFNDDIIHTFTSKLTIYAAELSFITDCKIFTLTAIEVLKRLLTAKETQNENMAH